MDLLFPHQMQLQWSESWCLLASFAESSMKGVLCMAAYISNTPQGTASLELIFNSEMPLFREFPDFRFF